MHSSPNARSLRIGYVPALGRGGGIARLTEELLRALADLPDVELVDVRPLTPTSKRLGRLLSAGVVDLFRSLFGVRRDVEADILLMTKHAVPRRSPIPTVLVVHDMVLFSRGKDYGFAKRWFMPLVYKSSVRRASRLVCISEHTRSQLLSSYPLLDDRAVAVPLAPSSSVLSAEISDVRLVLPQPYVLFVGNDLPRKRIDKLLTAIGMVGARHDVSLVVAGSGLKRRSSLELLGQPSTRARTIEIQNPSDCELRWLYKNAAMTCVPSDEEGFGLPAAESYALGTPVLVSDCAALVEATNGTGVVIRGEARQWAEAIERELESPTRLRSGAFRTWHDVACDVRSELWRARKAYQ